MQEKEFDYDFGISEEEEDARIRNSIRISKEISRIKGNPTCEYDKEKKAAYLLFPDGHREYPTLD